MSSTAPSTFGTIYLNLELSIKNISIFPPQAHPHWKNLQNSKIVLAKKIEQYPVWYLY